MVGSRIAVLGLGEAGREIASDLADAGFTVVGYDPVVPSALSGVALQASEAQAATGARLVLSVNSAAAALAVARRVTPVLVAGQVFADLNSASPDLKLRLAEETERGGADFCDVALLAPVPGRGARTPSIASGRGAPRFAEMLRLAGMPVTTLDAPAGAAAAHKLLRSVVMKGFAAAILEARAAATALGAVEWLDEQVAAIFADPGLLKRFVEGTVRHAARRTHEMEAARELLLESGVEPYVTTAVLARLTDLATT